jgi:hypothetical protein
MTLSDWEEWIEDEDFIISDSPDQISAFEIHNERVFCIVCQSGWKVQHKKNIVPDYALVGATPNKKQAMDTHLKCEYHTESLPAFLDSYLVSSSSTRKQPPLEITTSVCHVPPTQSPQIDQNMKRITFPQISKVMTRDMLASKHLAPSLPSSSTPLSSQGEKEDMFLDAVSKRMIMIHHIVRNKQSNNSLFSLQNLMDIVQGNSLVSFLGHTSTCSMRGFVMALKKAVKENLKLKLKKHRRYSIMVDDSKDKGGIIEMSVYIRYMGPNEEVFTSFLSFCQLDEKGASAPVLFKLLV